MALLRTGRRNGDGHLVALYGGADVLTSRDGQSVDDSMQHVVERGKLRILPAVGDVLSALRGHDKLGAVHDELIFAGIGRDADIVGLANVHRASGYKVGLNGLSVGGLGDVLCINP